MEDLCPLRRDASLKFLAGVHGTLEVLLLSSTSRESTDKILHHSNGVRQLVPVIVDSFGAIHASRIV